MIDWDKVSFWGIQTGRFSNVTPNFVEMARVDEICICTHPRGSHTPLKSVSPYVPGCGNCWAGFGKFSERYNRSNHEFKRDNLKYLEGMV
jgi:hypothetical protein